MREKNHLKLFPIHTRVHNKIPFLLESVIIWRRLWTMDHSSSSLQVPLPCDSGPDAISVLILFSVNDSYRLSTPENMVQQFNFFNVKKKNNPSPCSKVHYDPCDNTNPSDWDGVFPTVFCYHQKRANSVLTVRTICSYWHGSPITFVPPPMMLWLFYASLFLAPLNQIWTLNWHVGLKKKKLY